MPQQVWEVLKEALVKKKIRGGARSHVKALIRIVGESLAVKGARRRAGIGVFVELVTGKGGSRIGQTRACDKPRDKLKKGRERKGSKLEPSIEREITSRKTQLIHQLETTQTKRSGNLKVRLGPELKYLEKKRRGNHACERKSRFWQSSTFRQKKKTEGFNPTPRATKERNPKVRKKHRGHETAFRNGTGGEKGKLPQRGKRSK